MYTSDSFDGRSGDLRGSVTDLYAGGTAALWSCYAPGLYETTGDVAQFAPLPGSYFGRAAAYTMISTSSDYLARVTPYDYNVGPEGYEGGVVARYVNDSNFYVATVQYGLRTIVLWRVVAGSWTILGHHGKWPNAEGQFVGDAGFEGGDSLALQVVGSELTAYRNDLEVITVIDDRIVAGWPGIYCSTSAGSSHVQIVDYRVDVTIPKAYATAAAGIVTADSTVSGELFYTRRITSALNATTQVFSGPTSIDGIIVARANVTTVVSGPRVAADPSVPEPIGLLTAIYDWSGPVLDGTPITLAVDLAVDDILIVAGAPCHGSWYMGAFSITGVALTHLIEQDSTLLVARVDGDATSLILQAAAGLSVSVALVVVRGVDHADVPGYVYGFGSDSPGVHPPAVLFSYPPDGALPECEMDNPSGRSLAVRVMSYSNLPDEFSVNWSTPGGMVGKREFVHYETIPPQGETDFVTLAYDVSEHAGTVPSQPFTLAGYVYAPGDVFVGSVFVATIALPVPFIPIVLGALGTDPANGAPVGVGQIPIGGASPMGLLTEDGDDWITEDGDVITLG